MNKLKVIFLSLCIILSSFNMEVFAANDTKEMRAVWISTVYNIDWPSTRNNESAQKQEYIKLLDKLKNIGINTVVVQVRPKGDAIYSSSINPWSEYLTGSQGKNPGYDPLPFLIDEAHKRGMDFHAWFNPYRITTDSADLNSLASTHPARLHPNWVIKYKNGAYDALMYNPGLPETRKHIVDTVLEVVKKYDVDGIHFDDYFYKDGMNDDAAYNKYGNGKNKNDWRRENVNLLLSDVKSAIKSVKPKVVFGVSPSGIWRNKANDPTGSDTKGNESYSSSYADSRTWIQRGLVDYIVPQIYWTIGFEIADYSKLVSWWSNEVANTNVDLYIGQGVYRQGGSDSLNVAKEIKQQVALNRKYKEIKGSMYFSARDIINNQQLQNDIKSLYTNSVPNPEPVPKPDPVPNPGPVQKVQMVNTDSLNVRSGPGTTYSVIGSLNKGTKVEVLSESNGWSKINYNNGIGYVSTVYLSNINIPSIPVKSLQGNNRFDTAVSISKEGWPTGAETLIITSANSIIDGVTSTPLASVKDAPILLANKNNIPSSTENELKRLNPNNIIIVGGDGVVDNTVYKYIQSILPNCKLNRIGGVNRYETSLNVANEISKYVSIDKVYIAGGNGEADALSIASKAGSDKQPIILTEKNTLPANIYNWLKDKSIKDSYFIGGNGVISDAVISKVNSITTNNVLNNRLNGANREETNAKVLQKFYSNSNYDSLFVTKSNPLIDALTAGPLASKNNSPIIILGSNLAKEQENTIKNKKFSKMYKVGGDIKQDSFNALLNALN